MDSVTGHPIRAVARQTGISLDTLRAWERRYQAVVPGRGERGRVYSDRDVERLKRLATLVEQGHAIGAIAALSDRQLSRLLTRDEAPVQSSGGVDLEPLFLATKRYDLESIDVSLNRYALLLPPDDLIFQVVLPMLRETGARWQAGAISPAQEHLVSGIVRGVLGGVLRSMPRPRGRRIVFATPAGERHELGLLCGAVLAAMAGYAAVYLGPDLPAADTAAASAKADATTLVLAATASGSDYAGLTAFKRLPDRMAIWVGGARGADLRRAIGPRARLVDSLEQLRGLLDRHGS